MTETAPDPSCAACGALLDGPFCAACGERRPSPDDERIGPFLSEQFQEVTSADGKLWRTVRALFVPGKLTEEYFAGRRSLYVRPVRIFLVVNVALFFLLRGNNGSFLKGPLTSNLNAALYGPTAERLVTKTAAAWGIGLDEFQLVFDMHATSLAPSLLGVLIPGYALLFAVVFWSGRASVLRHLVLATHIVSALMAGSIVIMVVVSVGISMVSALTGSRVEDFDLFMLPALMTTYGVYLGVSLMRVYRVGTAYAVGAGVVLATLGFAFAFWLYRLVLFFVTFWTLGPPSA